MSATYFVDITGNMVKRFQDAKAQNKGPVGWTLIEKSRDLTEYREHDGGIQRWKVEDEGAGPEHEGRLIEPVLGTQTSLRFGAQWVIEDRKILA